MVSSILDAPCSGCPCTFQLMSKLFVATESCDRLIPDMPWLTNLSSSADWIPSQYPTYPAMFRQVCHVAKQEKKKTGPNAVCIPFWTTVLSPLQTRNLEPEYYSCEDYRPVPTTNLYLKVKRRWNGIVSEMKHQSPKGDPCIWCGGHWKNTSPKKKQHCANFFASKAPTLSGFVISFALCRKEDQHAASYSHQLSTCIQTIFVLDCDQVF